jgi:predicted  nucleic acid-binding Zn-ribbon protein
LKKLNKKLEDGRNKLNEIMNQSSVTAMQQLTRWDRKVTDLRETIQNFAELKQYLKEDIFSFETAIAYASNKTKELYVKAAEIDSEVSNRNERVLEILNYILELRTKIEQDSGKMLNVAERIKQLYAMIDDEENKYEKLTKQLEKEMLEKGQWNNTRATLNEKSRDLDIEIHCAQNNLSMLSSKGTELAYTVCKLF